MLGLLPLHINLKSVSYVHIYKVTGIVIGVTLNLHIKSQRMDILTISGPPALENGISLFTQFLFILKNQNPNENKRKQSWYDAHEQGGGRTGLHTKLIKSLSLIKLQMDSSEPLLFPLFLQYLLLFWNGITGSKEINHLKTVGAYCQIPFQQKCTHFHSFVAESESDHFLSSFPSTVSSCEQIF